MHCNFALTSLTGLACLSAMASAAPFSFPLPNGFPEVANPSSQLTEIEKTAHGSLPNGPPPAKLTDDTFTSLRLIAFNELAEVAFFTELVSNITNRVYGYDNFVNAKERDFVLNALIAVQAQEELHALNANGALAKFNKGPIQACKYNFPVSNFGEAIALATTFTDVVLGTLQDVSSLLGSDGDAGLIRGVASVIGQEGEQNGLYRVLLDKIPSALPFLTTGTREFAFSALNQGFIVPGSCPNLNTIALPIFQPLTVDTKDIDAKASTLQFSFTANPSQTSTSFLDGLSLVYINQQNTPVVEKLQDVKVKGTLVTFKATFPFDQATFGNGLTIAAVTSGATSFANAPAVAKATIFGPGLIEVN